MNTIVLNEKELSDDFPVHMDYIYVCDGKPIRSDISGTVRDLKRDLRSYYKLEANVITNYDMPGRIKQREQQSK